MAQSQLTADWTDSAGLDKTVHPVTARGCVQVFKGCLFGLIHPLTLLFVVVFHNWNNRSRWGIESTIVKLQRIIEQFSRTPCISSNSVWSFMERELSVYSLVWNWWWLCCSKALSITHKQKTMLNSNSTRFICSFQFGKHANNRPLESTIRDK